MSKLAEGLSIQFVERAHVERKKWKQETKTNASAHLIQRRFMIREDSPGGIRMTMEESLLHVY